MHHVKEQRHNSNEIIKKDKARKPSVPDKVKIAKLFGKMQRLRFLSLKFFNRQDVWFCVSKIYCAFNEIHLNNCNKYTCYCQLLIIIFHTAASPAPKLSMMNNFCIVNSMDYHDLWCVLTSHTQTTKPKLYIAGILSHWLSGLLMPCTLIFGRMSIS